MESEADVRPRPTLNGSKASLRQQSKRPKRPKSRLSTALAADPTPQDSFSSAKSARAKPQSDRLLAGKGATANITAVAPSTVYELTKADLKPILEARPEIALELSRAMAQRLEAGRGLTTIELDRTVPARGSSAWLSRHIRKLFELSITN